VDGNPWWFLGMPLIGYGCAWVGHFFFEHNKPATFRYPAWSLLGDWVIQGYIDWSGADLSGGRGLRSDLWWWNSHGSGAL
jgi:hypothetical protein